MIPATSRRALIGSAAAMLLAGAFEAGASKAAELDGDIIEASRDYVALEAELARLCKLEGSVPEPERDGVLAQAAVVMDQQEGLRAVVATTPARTPEGLRAKAAALQAWMPASADGTAAGDDDDDLAWSLCNGPARESVRMPNAAQRDAQVVALANSLQELDRAVHRS